MIDDDDTREAGQRGMGLFRKEAVGFKVSNYMIEAALPTLPKAGFGHVGRAAPGGDWKMLGNNKYGDCVLAGAAHEEMHWANSANHPIPNFTDEVIIQQYLEMTGGADNGLDPVEAAKYRRRTGLVDANGRTYRIKSYALIDSIEELAYTCYLFDVAAVGLYLPSNAEDQFDASEPWDDLTHPADPNRGHYVPVIGRNSHGLWICVTWRRHQAISDRYLKKYCFGANSGALAYLSKSYLRDTGKTPEAFNEAQLDADLEKVAALPHGEA